MARLKSSTKYKGRIGDITFFKSRHDGYLVREKGGIDGNRIKTDPRFARTRENGAEFGRAGSAGKLVRVAFMQFVNQAKDGRVTSRLMKRMMVALKSDKTSKRGERTVSKGDLQELNGFEFNDQSQMTTVVPVKRQATVDRAAGTMTITFDKYIPNKVIQIPMGATHYRLLASVAELEFDTLYYSATYEKTAEMPLDDVEAGGPLLQLSFTANSKLALVAVLGIEFLQDVNGGFYGINTGENNPLSIVHVEPAV